MSKVECPRKRSRDEDEVEERDEVDEGYWSEEESTDYMEWCPWANPPGHDEPTNQKPDKTAQAVQNAMVKIWSKGFDRSTCRCPFSRSWNAQNWWRGPDSVVPDWIKDIDYCNCKGNARGFKSLSALYQHSTSTDRGRDDLLCHRGFALWLWDKYPELHNLRKPPS